MLLCSLLTFAQFSGTVSDSQGVRYSANDDDSTCYVSGHETNYSTAITIPEVYEGRTVTSIGGYAFYNCSGLTSVTIPNSVTSIGNGAFFGCSDLTSVTIPNSVTSIGDAAFSECKGLTSVTIPNSVTFIGNDAFFGCSGLTSVTIPNSVTSIGKWAFHGCSGLTSVIVENGNPKYDSRNNCNAIIEIATNTLLYGCNNTVIPNSVTSIGEDAFYGCSGLTSVSIPNSVTSIGDYAFFRCNGLTSVTIPNSVTSIGMSAFSDCSGLTSVTIPNSVASIGSYAFRNCSGLTSIIVENGNPKYDSRNNCNAIIETATNTLLHGCKNTVIPNSVTSIGSYAFRSCSGLTSISIPNSVISIGNDAFYDCSGLTSVTIPNSVTSIGIGAFAWCSGLTSIIVENGNPRYDSRNNCNAIIETATNTLYTGCMNTVIPNSVTSIGDQAFIGCSGLTSVSIPNSVTSIENYAFQNCIGLTSVTIPNSVTFIGICAFANCYGLTSVTIPNSVTSIGASAFQNCIGLTSITIPNSVTSIGNYAFCYCIGLEEVKTFVKEPFTIKGCWDLVKTEEIPLYVPQGTKALYEATEGWNVFKNIIEMDDNDIDPVNGDGSVDFSEDDGIDDDTDLDGNVIGNIYYVIGDDNGEYSSAEGCVIIRKPTSDEQVDNLSGQDLFGEDLKNNYTGIIFKVQAGSGTIKVNAESVGGMTLKVKIGNNAPFTMELEGKMKVTIPYTVTEPTYIYIYAGGSSASARGINRAGADSALKIYGFEWSQSSSDVNSIYTKATNSDGAAYNMNGQRVWTTPMQKGVYIVNGRKVVRP